MKHSEINRVSLSRIYGWFYKLVYVNSALFMSRLVEFKILRNQNSKIGFIKKAAFLACRILSRLVKLHPVKNLVKTEIYLKC